MGYKLIQIGTIQQKSQNILKWNQQ